MYSQLVQFMLTSKGYDNNHSLNKPQTENEAGAWITSCPEEMVLRICGFLKKGQLRVEIGPWRQRVKFSTIELSFLLLRRWLSFSGLDRQR